MPSLARQSLSLEFETADKLHSAAIHLLRRLRDEDTSTGLSGPRLSALSVVVFGGPISIGDLAKAEQVRPPTMTRLVRQLERDGLLKRVSDRTDRRIVRVQATARGRKLLQQGRARRVQKLANELSTLPRSKLRLLARAAKLLEDLSRPTNVGSHRDGGFSGGK